MDIKRKQSLFVVLFFVGIVLLIGVFLLAHWNAARVFRAKISKPGLAEISETTGIHFPDGTRMLSSYQEKWEDTLMIAKLEMDSESIGEFIKSLPYRRETSRTEKYEMDRLFGSRTDIPEWWNPNSQKKFQAVRLESTDNLSTTVISISTDGQSRIVYLCWMRT